MTYTLQMHMAAATSSASYGGDTNGDIDVLCIPSCDQLPISGSGVMDAAFDVLASGAPAGGLIGGGDWKPVSLTFTPTADCPAIIFGPASSQSIQAGESGTYVMYDMLNLQNDVGVCNSDGEAVCMPALHYTACF